MTGHPHPFGVLLVEASSGGKNPTGGGKSPNKLLVYKGAPDSMYII